MSEYFDNCDFDALVAPNEETFDLSFLETLGPIGQDDDIDGYEGNAAFGLDPDLDLASYPGFPFDPHVGFPPAPSLPVLPDSTATTGQ
jgi:hypothetical protein